MESELIRILISILLVMMQIPILLRVQFIRVLTETITMVQRVPVLLGQRQIIRLEMPA